MLQQGQVWRLEADVGVLQQDVAKRLALSVKMPGVTGGVEPGFLRYFQAVSRNIEEGLWLTRMTVDQEGKRLVVEGRAVAASQPLRYVQRLDNHPLFSQRWRFKSLAITPSAGEGGRYIFQVMGEQQP